MDSSVAKLILKSPVGRSGSPREKIRTLAEAAAACEQSRAAVETHGGRILFTEGVAFSSSELINRHLNVFEPHIREHLDTLRQDGGLDQLCELIEPVADYPGLIAGDATL